jgi:alanine racemase
MDLTILDVTRVPGVSVGDEIILIGASTDCKITAWEHARFAATVPYDILCSIGKRVPRFYLD